MKKLILLFVAVVGFTLMSSTITAQTNTNTEKAVVKTEQTAVTPGNFVDKNKNNICDNFEAKVKSGKGANFVDKNADGVCDKRAEKAKMNPNCNGKGMGKGMGKGNCCGQKKGNCNRVGQKQ